MFMGILFLLFMTHMAFWYARKAGLMWHEAMHSQPWVKIVLFAATTFSATGFTFTYLIVIGLLIKMLGLSDHEVLKYLLYLQQWIIMPFVSFSALILYLDLFEVWKRRGFESGNVIQPGTRFQLDTISSTGSAMAKIREFLGIEDKSLQALIVTLFLFSIFLGIYTTAVIIMHYKTERKVPHPFRTYPKRRRD